MGPNGQPVSHYADWGDAIGQRRYIDKQIDWNRLGGGSEAPMQESLRRFVAGDLRAGTKDALEQGVRNGTLPAELNAGWNNANNDYRLAAAVQDPAVARVYQEYGNQKISLPAWNAFSSQENPLRGGLAGIAADFVKYRGARRLPARSEGSRTTRRRSGWRPRCSRPSWPSAALGSWVRIPESSAHSARAAGRTRTPPR
jgi:hypothetical protein